MDTSKKLYRSEKKKMIAGVCAGLADYLSVDVNLVRILFVLGSLFGFSATFWIYIIMWVVVPADPTK